MRDSLYRIVFPALVALIAVTSRVSAQCTDSASARGFSRLVLVGDDSSARWRDADALGTCARYSLIRSALGNSRVTASRFAVLAPVVSTTWNSSLPLSLNDGAQWAGRGFSALAMAGARSDGEHFSVIIAPEITASQNRGFPIIGARLPARTEYTGPFHGSPYSADIPLRFGNRPFTSIGFGQSSVEVRARGLGVGLSTENQWWGPGVQNAIVMSNNAQGVPHAFGRTARPLRTRLGEFEGRYMLGLLTKSLWFDGRNDGGLRSLNGAIITLRPSFDSTLTLGASRVVYAPIFDFGSIYGHAADLLVRWDQPRHVTSDREHRSSQLMSFFFRWSPDAAGFEAYAEWARLNPFNNFEDLVVSTSRSQAYTIGLRRISPLGSAHRIRVQAEMTNLEQGLGVDGGPAMSYYTSFLVPEGYTQRGQVVGAAIGPGSSSQWFAMDWVGDTRSVGFQLRRVRWDDDAYFRDPLTVFSYRHHDVSLQAGVRASARVRRVRYSGEMLFDNRNNYLNQSHDLIDYSSGFDMRNLTLRMTLTPDS